MRVLGEAVAVQIFFGPLGVLAWFALDVALGVVLLALARAFGRD